MIIHKQKQGYADTEAARYTGVQAVKTNERVRAVQQICLFLQWSSVHPQGGSFSSWELSGRLGGN